MKQRGFYEPQPNSNCGCAEHITLAERKLSAFFRAVTELTVRLPVLPANGTTRAERVPAIVG